MKNLVKVLSLIALAALTTRCSDEAIEPQTVPTEDQITSANAYQDQFLTFDITTNEDRDIQFYLSGMGGKISINWGDGDIEKIVLAGEYIQFAHTYDRTKNYTIKISGDIKTITVLDMAYESLRFRKIHFAGLTNLVNVNMHLFEHAPPVINLSQNKKIEDIKLVGLQELSDIILPVQNKITFIDIAGENALTTAVVDRVIARVHDSVINIPRAGFFNVSSTWYTSEGDNTMVGPPSSWSINKLRKLQNIYGWNISPDIQ